MRRSLITLPVIAALVIAMTGCSAGTAPTASPSETPTASPTPTEEPKEYAPLTGVEVEPGSLVRPAMAAKIDNHVDARPQIGLDKTDIVFEELVEGGLTRYVAVWHSQLPKTYGPIRSIRPMDPDIVSPFGGMITYSGGQQKFITMMQNTNVLNIIHGQSGTADTIYRIDSKIAPHNVVVKAQVVNKQHAELAAPMPSFSFAAALAEATAVTDGTATKGAVVTFDSPSTPKWKWSAEKQAWVRFQTGGAIDTDFNGVQLQATNVIVQRVKESHEYGYVPRANVVGYGTAWIFTGGKYIEAKWEKKDRESFTTYTIKATGEEVTLAPGNTWIELMPIEGNIKILAP